MQSKAVDGFHTEEQQALQAQQQQAQQAQMTQAQSQPQQVLLPPVQQGEAEFKTSLSLYCCAKQ